MPSRPMLTTSGSGSTVSTSSRMAGQRPGTGSSAPVAAPTSMSRPMSPVKPATASPSVVSLQGSAMPPGPAIRPGLASPPSLAPSGNPPGKRRVSIEAPARQAPSRLQRGHSRTGSVPTFDQLVLPKYPARAPQSPEATSVVSPPLSPGLARPAMSMASLLQAAEELEEEDEDSGSEHTPPEVSSPTKSTPSGDPISELVANARRERKVQDLEITNASLEAINRTLERQLRKQTAELRRYRRLSRAGRLSAPSSRVASAAMTEPPIDMSDVSEEESDSEAQDSFHESDLSTDDETGSQAEPMSPNAKMAARRKRDEMRLQLDLTKHQELLIDSQKINQSIKRCMDWTEVLIKEGQKALAYHVRVSDVELGGKVLAPPDEDDEDGGLARREETPEVDGLEKIPSITLEPATEKPPPARDSGIELAPDGG
ncbi:uncharacterized protein F5Z01DRAFT_645440 [Emericellopsis atlantica]|uniref:Uncharacterized protein n=1 Tax=Emericellopsis atlantica TaxID=2614577 RepID=A0A9P7ZUV8_9HYPO|nr:uncharacterized protein F5Z01DRAFT_645440 [Emericellopsis atlantica]KAG9258231.1 hypothetical protein F5Z01DRAFT_645440 [Emericellopsis atlantica]